MRRVLLGGLLAPFLLAACGHDDRPVVVNPQPTATVVQPQQPTMVVPQPGSTVVVPSGTRVCPAGTVC